MFKDKDEMVERKSRNSKNGLRIAVEKAIFKPQIQNVINRGWFIFLCSEDFG